VKIECVVSLLHCVAIATHTVYTRYTACHANMSPFSYNQPNQLTDDVLLMIFDQLDEEDLLRCETVCRQWRNVLLSGKTWRKLFRRQIASSPQWRNVVRIFRVDVEKLATVHHRSLCRAIIEELKQIDRNWRTGNFKRTCSTDSFENISDIIVLGDRIAVYSSSGSKMTIVHRTSLQVISSVKIPDGSFAVTNTEIVVVWDKKNIKILDTNGQLISRVPELDEDERISWNLASCCVSGDHMAVLSRSDGQQKLSLWDVSDPLRITRLKSQHFGLSLPLGFDLEMKMDEQFIAVTASHFDAPSIHFFSKQTLDLHWQIYGDILDDFAYGKGLLLRDNFLKNIGSVFRVYDVYDVTTRIYFGELHIKAKRKYNKPYMDFNSKFMVVVQRSEHEPSSEINIYDLEVITNPNSKKSPDEHLVHSVTEEFDFKRIVVTETEILCQDKKIRILNFGSFECIRNEAKSVTLSLPWRSVWRSKGVEEEPLEHVRHMELYKEILKYFHQLSMNCQMATKCYPVDDLDLVSFTVGADLINDRQLAVLVKMYVEEMNESCQEMNHKTVEINTHKHGPVICIGIQLIDVTTGDIINKMKLNIGPIGFHYGGNLLVCVHQIAEHEHLLSVWRVDNSLNFTHIKNMSIGGYNRYACGLLQVDEHFIVVHVPNEHTVMTFNFISLKTFQVERSLTCYYGTSYYDGGYLFLINSDFLVRILDVASGTFLHDIRMEASSIVSVVSSRVNSNYVVIAAIQNNWSGHSSLYVYDLKCLKETDTVPSHLLLTTIKLKCEVKAMMVNETRIVCLNSNKMYVVDLKPIDRLRCPESCQMKRTFKRRNYP
jgi:F-box-like